MKGLFIFLRRNILRSLEEQLWNACCITGSLYKVKNIIKYGVDTQAYGKALQLAAYYNHLDIVKYLISNLKVGIEKIDEYTFYWIMRNKNYEIIQYLRTIAGDKWKCHDCLVRAACMNICENYFNIDKIIKFNQII
jgi:hypothetical protein